MLGMAGRRGSLAWHRAVHRCVYEHKERGVIREVRPIEHGRKRREGVPFAAPGQLGAFLRVEVWRLHQEHVGLEPSTARTCVQPNIVL